jgi:hypothetical protein
MDGTRFDSLTKHFAAELSRRRVVKALVATAASGLAGLIDKDASAVIVCRGAGLLCRVDANCCPPATCLPNGRGGTKVCTCPPNTIACNELCVDPASYSTDPVNCGQCGKRCTAAAHARATCDQGVCDWVCAAGYHLCNGACVADNDVAHCGDRCDPCPAPANATASCEGISCGFACDANYVPCAGDCCPTTCCDDTFCCDPTPENADVVCGASGCEFPCRDGFHRCGDTCVANDDLAHCGDRCDPCPAPPANATATCNGVTCGFACDAGYDECGDGCCNKVCCNTICCDPPPENADLVCGDNVCEYPCRDGFHVCGSACVSDDSTDHCGDRCDPCPVPDNATGATCDGTTCGFTCDEISRQCGDGCCTQDRVCCESVCCELGEYPAFVHDCNGTECVYACFLPGLHACGSTCVDSTGIEHCGDRCDPCPVPDNATATCDGTSCGFTCDDGFVECNGACCPTACCANICCGTPPENAEAVCGANGCEFPCREGFHLCGTACVDSNSIEHCGNRCDPCPTPEGFAVATCDGTTCGIDCFFGSPCGNGCCANACCNGTCCLAGETCQGGFCTRPCTADRIVSCNAGGTPCGVDRYGLCQCHARLTGEAFCASNAGGLGTCSSTQACVGAGTVCLDCGRCALPCGA